MLRQTTLVFLVKKFDGIIADLCLARKKRGFGAQIWNGVGGKLEPGETTEQAALRETREEIGVSIRKMSKHAELEFVYLHEPSWNQKVHVYLADDWAGDPSESEEMAPQWFGLAEIPFGQMWSDDSIWLPRLLKGESVRGRFIFDGEDMKECRTERIAFL